MLMTLNAPNITTYKCFLRTSRGAEGGPFEPLDFHQVGGQFREVGDRGLPWLYGNSSTGVSPYGTIYAYPQGRFIHKAEEAEASGPTKPRGPQSRGGPPRPILLITLKIHGKIKWQ